MAFGMLILHPIYQIGSLVLASAFYLTVKRDGWKLFAGMITFALIFANFKGLFARASLYPSRATAVFPFRIALERANAASSGSVDEIAARSPVETSVFPFARRSEKPAPYPF